MKYYLINRENKWVELWDSRNDLLIDLKGQFDFHYGMEYRAGVDNLVYSNNTLKKCCHNWNDHHREYGRTGLYLEFVNLVYYDYQIIDGFGRIQNIPDLAIEAWSIKLPDESSWYPRYRSLENGTPWWSDDKRWNMIGRRCRHIDWQRPKRRGYIQEKRCGYDRDLMPYIRGIRRGSGLQGHKSRGSHHMNREVTWKQRKLKKQYMEKVVYG